MQIGMGFRCRMNQLVNRINPRLSGSIRRHPEDLAFGTKLIQNPVNVGLCHRSVRTQTDHNCVSQLTTRLQLTNNRRCCLHLPANLSINRHLRKKHLQICRTPQHNRIANCRHRQRFGRINLAVSQAIKPILIQYFFLLHLRLRILLNALTRRLVNRNRLLRLIMLDVEKPRDTSNCQSQRDT